MLGYVAYREAHSAQPPLLRLCGVCFRAVYVLRGEGIAARISAQLAARGLRRAGVRRALFPKDFTWRAVFERSGVSAVSAAPLHLATAAAVVRFRMAQRGLAPRGAVLAFAAERVTPELRRAVRELSAEVRYITLAVPRGGEELARELRRGCGVAARLAAPGEAPLADLTVAFSPVPAAGDVLALYDPALTVEYAGMPPEPLLAALWTAGAVDAGTLRVRAIRDPA